MIQIKQRNGWYFVTKTDCYFYNYIISKQSNKWTSKSTFCYKSGHWFVFGLQSPKSTLSQLLLIIRNILISSPPHENSWTSAIVLSTLIKIRWIVGLAWTINYIVEVIDYSSSPVRCPRSVHPRLAPVLVPQTRCLIASTSLPKTGS